MGTAHPPPSPLRKARSAVTALRVDSSSSAASRLRVVWSVDLHWTAKAPCPGAGSMTSKDNHSVTCCSKPKRVNPAPAKMIASYWPSIAFRTRVSILPRSDSVSKSGRAAKSCAARRKLDVPTTAFCGSVASINPLLEMRTSRTSARTGIHPMVRPSEFSTGKSLSEWTAQCTALESNSFSSSCVNRPFPPISGKGLSRILSPCVEMIFSSQIRSEWSLCKALITHCACQRARAEGRVAKMSFMVI